MQNGLWKAPEGIVICDIDGTIANIKHRLHFLEDKENKDWKGFFNGVLQDKFRHDVWERVSALANEGYSIFLVSARPEQCRQDTHIWLAENDIVEGRDYVTLFMRGVSDRRDDTEVKQDILELFQEQKIIKVFDDRPKVIRMWREHGLDVEDVGEGKEF